MQRVRVLAYSLFIGAAWPCAAAWAKPVIYLQDCMAAPDGTTTIVADLKKTTLFGIHQDIENKPVRFFCGGKELGRTTCDEHGLALLECKLPDAQVTAIEATAAVDGAEIRAEARVFRWDPMRVIVVVDIDDTISDTDFDDAWLDEEDRDSKPIRHSRETLNDLTRDYQILYLTARPSFLLHKTQRWLAAHGFPAAPVIVSCRKTDLLQQGVFKQRQLDRLKRRWPNVLIGIGDRQRDARAYGHARMLSLILSRKQEDYGRHSVRMPDWTVIHEFFKDNRSILIDPETCRQAIAGTRPLHRVVSLNRRGADDLGLNSESQ